MSSRIAAGLALAAAIVVLLAMMAVAAIAMSLGGGAPGLSGSGAGIGVEGGGAEPAVSALARAEIPASYLRLYIAAARRYGLDWAILAGIGRVECDNGLDPAPSCTQEGAVNSAGAGGPMQFLASTWATYGVDGDEDGRIDRWDPGDAIFSAANYLRAAGAPGDYEKAIFAYNHAGWYVREVEHWARLYSASGGGAESALSGTGTGTSASGAQPAAGTGATARPPVLYIPGQEAKLLRGDGHVALIPTGVPAAVQAMLIAGNELQDLPYGPAGHPDPLGAASEDCSSTVNFVLYEAGIRPLSEIIQDNPLAQDYVHWGDAGPGRWVTIYATDRPTPHVFMVIAGLRLDTAYQGIDEGPNRFEGGPRWRLLPHIPTWVGECKLYGRAAQAQSPLTGTWVA